MGGHIYYYFVPHQDDINAALQALRKQEFEAGRYNPVMPFPFDREQNRGATPGPKHRSMEAALEASEADGTRSILDMVKVGTRPGVSTVVPASKERLLDLYDTEAPTHQMIQENMDFFEDLDRGHGVYIIVHKDNRPSEIFFAGISYD